MCYKYFNNIEKRMLIKSIYVLICTIFVYMYIVYIFIEIFNTYIKKLKI